MGWGISGSVSLGSIACGVGHSAEPVASSSPREGMAGASAGSASSSGAAAESASASASQALPAATASVSPSASRHAYRIAAIGDSLTDPKSHGGGYLDYIRKRCPKTTIDNFGRGGFMVNQMRRRFDSEVAPEGARYTHLIVFGGVNDLYSDLTAFRTPAKIEADLSHMYGGARQRGMKVVALTVAPWGGFTRYFNPSRRAATREVNAWIAAQKQTGAVDSVVDAFALLSCGDEDVLCDRFFAPFRDGIHFGPGGHEILGEALYRAAFSDCQ
jgi:lysophospholipase L1-like esterase